jgi:hypothetical protein
VRLTLDTDPRCDQYTSHTGLVGPDERRRSTPGNLIWGDEYKTGRNSRTVWQSSKDFDTGDSRGSGATGRTLERVNQIALIDAHADPDSVSSDGAAQTGGPRLGRM